MAQRRKSLVPCKSYQYRSRSSNKCRNYKNSPKRKSRRKSTRRKSRRKSSRGKKSLVPCKSYQYRSRSSNKCRNYKNSPKRKSSRRKSTRRTSTRRKSLRSPKTLPSQFLPLRSQVQPPLRSQVQPPLRSQVQPPLRSQVQPPLRSQVQPPLRSQVQPPLRSQEQSRPLALLPQRSQVQQSLRSQEQSRPLALLPQPKNNSVNTIKPVGPGIPLEFRTLVEDCNQIAENWRIKDYVGSGQYGETHQICKKDNKDCKYVLKRQNLGKEFYNEVNSLYDLQSTGVVPKIYAAWTCKGIGYIVEELLQPCNNITLDQRYIQVKNALDIIKDHGWLHIDVKPDNTLCADDGRKVILIDFGWAVKKGAEGDNTLYPDHPIVKKVPASYLPITWKKLNDIQDMNLEIGFDNNYIDKDASLKAAKLYYELEEYPQSDIVNMMNILKRLISETQKINL